MRQVLLCQIKSHNTVINPDKLWRKQQQQLFLISHDKKKKTHAFEKKSQEQRKNMNIYHKRQTGVAKLKKKKKIQRIRETKLFERHHFRN